MLCTHVYHHNPDHCIPCISLPQNIQDWHLALFVACLVLIDLVILVPTTVILSTRLGATLVPHEENLFDVDQVRWSVEDNDVMYECN